MERGRLPRRRHLPPGTRAQNRKRQEHRPGRRGGKALLAAADIKQPVYYAELDWDAVCRLASQRNAPLRTAAQDTAREARLSLLLDSAVTMAQVEAKYATPTSAYSAA